MTSLPSDTRSNGLLAKLAGTTGSDRLERLKPITVAVGDVLYKAQSTIRYVYFPVDCLVSLIVHPKDQRPLEVAVVGSEGMVGVPLALGVRTSVAEAIVHGSGRALRMPAKAFMEELLRNSALRADLNGYIHALIAQLAQSSACNAFHPLEARCARWLLMARDRMYDDELELTQETLAHILGVRRVGVTIAAGNLQRRGALAYSRGRIVILDRARLAEAACECYAIVKDVYQHDLAARRVRRGSRGQHASRRYE